MRGTVAWISVCLVLMIGCGGDDPGGATPSKDSSTTQSASTSAGPSEPLLILTRMALTPGEEIVSSGKILDGSTIGDSAFCPGGTIEDKHGSSDPSEEPFGLVDRTITCDDGTLRMGFTPGVPEGDTQAGPWTIVSGTGAFEGMQGSGDMEMVYDSSDDSKGRETFTGTITR